jgi:PKD repeat protein
VEDCQWHRLRITWDPSSLWLRAYFDNVLRVEKQIDLITTIFNNDPNVYWGFTGATGGQVNLQQFCTALDPDFTVNLTGGGGCVGQPLQFSSTSQSFAPINSYTWDFGDNTGNNLPNPPAHVYLQPGNYNVKLKILGQDGCENDTSKNIAIGEIPSAELQIWDTCFGQVPRVVFNSTDIGTQSSWQADTSRRS